MQIYTCIKCLHQHPAYIKAQHTIPDKEYNLGELIKLGLKIEDIIFFDSLEKLTIHEEWVHAKV